jgi:hypothetical protein
MLAFALVGFAAWGLLPNGALNLLSPAARAAGFVVTTAADNGDNVNPTPGSLRKAILDANATAGKDTITFNIGTGPQSIKPAVALPTVAEPAIIDGTTQPGFAGTPIIEIDGTNLPANVSGLRIIAGDSTVKGLVINRCQTGYGLELSIGGGNIVVGNYIGTDITGTSAQGNFTGIGINQSPNNRIGGTTAAERNVISGNNSNSGIGIGGPDSTGNVIQGNYIGTNAAGTASLRNSIGVYIIGQAGNNTVGGPAAGARNVLSGNDQGVVISSSTPGSNGNQVQGNYIGTQPDGKSPLGNSFTGVHIGGGHDNLVGGTAAGEGNVIAFNGQANTTFGYGVLIETGGSMFRNGILGNSIYANNGPGIDLGGNGVTANDAGDPDTGVSTANEYQNYPVLTSAGPNGANTEIKGTLNSLAGTQFRLEFFASAAADVTGNGEGQFFLGSMNVTTDGAGDASFTFTVPTASIPGQFISATATDPVNNTSEFAKNISAPAPAAGILQFSGTSVSVSEGVGTAHVTVTRTGGSTGAVTLDYTTSDGSGNAAVAGSDFTATSGQLSFADGVTSKVIDVDITNDVVSEPTENFRLILSNPTGGALLGPNTIFNVNITDNDAPTVSISDVSLNEGNSGTTNATFVVTLSGAHFQSATVNYSTGVTGTATSGVDYQPASGQLTFAIGETSKNVTVLVNGDADAEPDETFFVNVTSSLGLADGQGQGTILNDDAPGPKLVQFGQSSFTVAEGADFVLITVTRTGDATQAGTVEYSSANLGSLVECDVFNGVATSRCDYSTDLGVLRFAPGETSKSYTVSVIDDAYVDGTETTQLTLSNPAGMSLGATVQATLTITDNDVGPSGTNPIDSAAVFIRQHYLDFLGREPEPAGKQGWLSVLNNCPAGSTACDRIEVSSGFFRSKEFQERGYFIYRFYDASLATIPDYVKFMPDLSRVSGFLSAQELEAAKQAFVADFMSRPEFKAKYDPLVDPTAYVDGLLLTAGLPQHPSRAKWITGLTNQTMTRAQVLREFVESAEVYQKFYNRGFVVMQYFGYLRRSPDVHYLEWLDTMTQTNGDYRIMINGFMNSAEYRKRFGAP